MKADTLETCIILSPKTAHEISSVFAYHQENKGERTPLKVRVSANAIDGVGHVIVDGIYYGTVEIK